MKKQNKDLYFDQEVLRKNTGAFVSKFKRYAVSIEDRIQIFREDDCW